MGSTGLQGTVQQYGVLCYTYMYTHTYGLVEVWGIRGMFGFGSTVMFFKIRGSFLGVSSIKIIVFWGLYRGPTFWETTTYTRIHKR